MPASGLLINISEITYSPLIIAGHSRMTAIYENVSLAATLLVAE